MKAETRLKALTVLLYILGTLGILGLLFVLGTAVMFNNRTLPAPRSWAWFIVQVGIMLLPMFVAISLSRGKKIGRWGALLTGAALTVYSLYIFFTANTTLYLPGHIVNGVMLIIGVLILLLAYPPSIIEPAANTKPIV